MGRPPIGKRAMTATERQRRWRAKSRANKPAPKPAASVRTVSLQARVRQLEADQAALIAAMGKLLLAMAQRLADRPKQARPVLEAAVREFRAVLARLRASDRTSRPKTRPDKVLDGRRFVVTVTGYRRHMFWLLDPDSNEVVGPLVPAHTPRGSKPQPGTAPRPVAGGAPGLVRINLTKARSHLTAEIRPLDRVGHRPSRHFGGASGAAIGGGPGLQRSDRNRSWRSLTVVVRDGVPGDQCVGGFQHLRPHS